ncbi:CaiB/BaiF CoA transferase family protein [Enterovirga aerilata]|uniref:CoA transferase n=1 Tax=Enterovirga aerilata TaxID=2730920 RepID=A0A849IFM2_9HYPH|nr:CoA transferase [Enterovirga sp. DB1703]NNM72703.1 CoA transferase [Enterovirga sp. DB1703]
MSGPLNGIRIADMTMNVLGPYGSQILGDMGADIIKIEPPEGDTLRGIGPCRHKGMGPYFLNLNRNKRSLALDLKKPEGKAVLDRILETVDVLIFSFRPKAMARLGLSYEEVAARNSRIIYCGASGFGQNGPYADRPAYDDLIQAAVGLPALQARKTDEPVYVAAAIADRVVGMALSSAVGMALYHREKTGRGQAIEIPMFETMTEFVMGDHLYGATFEPPLSRPGYVRMINPERRPYRTRDGHIGVLVYNDKHWRRFFELIDRPDMAADPRYTSIAGRTEHIEYLYGFLAETFATKTTREWEELLERADIPAIALATPDDLLNDPHLDAVGFFQTIDHPTEGRIRTMAVPQRWSESQPDIRRPAPTIGEHTREILLEVGFTQDGAESLIEAGIARGRNDRSVARDVEVRGPSHTNCNELISREPSC